MSRWTIVLAALLIAALVGLGCSGGGNPVTPAGSDLTAGASIQSGSGSQTHLWGYYDLYFDFNNLTVEAVPNRNVMFAANVTTFLNGKASNMGFNIIGTPVDPNFIDVDIDVTLTHPFPGLTAYNGYDVRGIFMGDGSVNLMYNSALKYAQYDSTDQVMYDYNLTEADIHSALLGNPDGYTRWWNPSEFTTPGVLGYEKGKLASLNYTPTATLNPYKYFADGLGVEDDAYEWLTTNQATHGVFSAGSSNTRNYYLRFPMPSPGVNYGYAVVANWKGEAPEDHPSNAPEPVAVSATVTTPDLYYVDGTHNGGDLILEINVFDWDATVSVTTGMVEDYALKIESSVLSTPYTLTGVEMEPIGGGENYSTFAVDIPADNVTGTDGNQFWVICEENGETYENTYGVTNLAGTDPLAAFFRYDLYVSPTSYCPDVTVTGADTGQPYGFVDKLPVTGIVITGDGFQGPTADVTFLSPTSPVGDVVATNVVIDSMTQITCDADFTGTPSGKFDVQVTNDCGKVGVGADLVQTPFDIRIYDSSPLGPGAISLPTPPSNMTQAIDLGVSPYDGDVYIAWALPPHGYSDIGYVDRYDPTATSTLMSAICWQYLQADEVLFQRDWVEMDVGYIGGVEGWQCEAGMIHYGSNDTDTAGVNDSYGFWGAGYGTACAAMGCCNASDGSVYGIGNQFAGGNYRTWWRIGTAGGDWDQLACYYLVPAEVGNNYIASDFDSSMTGHVKGIAMGNTRDSACWSLSTDVPHLKRYNSWKCIGYYTTGNFGNDGTNNGEIYDPVDITMRQNGNVIYVLDQPEAGKYRIQAFHTDGTFTASSGVLDGTDYGGGLPFSIDYNDLDDLIYILYDNNTIQALKDFTL